MRLKAVLTFLAIIALSVPVGTSAQTDSITDRLKKLLADLQTISSSLNSVAAVGAVQSNSCVTLLKNLSPGSTDAGTKGEVSKLQRFLVSQGVEIYPEAKVSGIYGPSTLKAVQRLQKKHGVVSAGSPSTTGYGAVGAATRALVTRLCGTTVSTGMPSVSIVSPQGGSVIALGKSAEVKWTATNVPRGSQVVISVRGIGTDTEWSSSGLQSNDSGSYMMVTGPGHIETPGEYKLTISVRGCGEYGCNDSFGGVGKTYATGNTVAITLQQPTVTPTLSPWGQVLVQNPNSIPENRFRAYWINYGTLKERLASELVDRVYFDYGGANTKHDYGGTFGTGRMGAYWVGKIYVPTNTLSIRLSDPQQDSARVYIDGALAKKSGRGSMGDVPFSTTPGWHNVQVEYESHWHAGTFAARFGIDVYDAIPGKLSAFVQSSPNASVILASAYSAHAETGELVVRVPRSSDPVILVLSSYDPVNWRLVADPQANIQSIVLASYAGASTVLNAPQGAKAYENREYLDLGYDEDFENTQWKLGFQVAAFAQYDESTKEMVFPEL
ncbi:MAG: hypothetical protein KBD06_00575 [Candidatus Pacebacteria bacterium]|nr:hypothetical protein [Candidatus Paceibacterota bacterium]